MIKGAKFWNNPNTMYSQINNPTEVILKALINETTWLESCGPTAAVNCLAAIGADLTITCPGTYNPQPEEILMDYFNDPVNRAALDSVRYLEAEIPKNRVPQYYPKGVKDVFNRKAELFWGLSWTDIETNLILGRAVQICLKNPGHYIAVVAVDTEKMEFIYNDSWGTRFVDGKGGWNRRMDYTEYKTNVQPYYIVYYP